MGNTVMTASYAERIASMTVWHDADLGFTCAIEIGVDECDVTLDMPSAQLRQTTASRREALAVAATWREQMTSSHSAAA
jgi:hypothetical protein